MGRTLRMAMVLLALAGAVAAAEDGLAVSEGTSVRDLLSKQVGKAVTLRLQGGEELSGKVQTVGGELVVLSPVSGRDFFDAAVRLDTVAAVLVRVRSN
jgi:hypothetical protein